MLSNEFVALLISINQLTTNTFIQTHSEYITWLRIAYQYNVGFIPNTNVILYRTYCFAILCLYIQACYTYVLNVLNWFI